MMFEVTSFQEFEAIKASIARTQREKEKKFEEERKNNALVDAVKRSEKAELECSELRKELEVQRNALRALELKIELILKG